MENLFRPVCLVDHNGSSSRALLHDAATARIAKLCPCNRAWKNHGEYVSCTTKAAQQFVDLGLISGVEKDAIVAAAGQSQCGHKKDNKVKK